MDQRIRIMDSWSCAKKKKTQLPIPVPGFTQVDIEYRRGPQRGINDSLVVINKCPNIDKISIEASKRAINCKSFVLKGIRLVS